MTDKVFVARNGLVANGTFLANSTVVNAAAVTATSVNAATLSISGTSVATLITGNAATAYANGTAYADARAANAFSNAVALSGNATNLTTGTLPLARLDANVVNTSAAFTITGTRTFNANVTFGASARIVANGSSGTAGQLLSSNGSGVYWADLGSVGTNTATPYSWTNTHVFSNTVTVNNSTFSVGSATVNTTITLGTITLSNGAAVATVNSTVYNGTANNASFFNGQQGSFYTNATNLSTGTVATARLGSGSPSSSTFLRGDQTWATPSTFPAGTIMLFVQTSAPTGWTKSTTHDNKALRVVSGSAGSGGSVSFTSAFSTQGVSGSVGSTTSTGTVGSTTLSILQIPAHTHPATSSSAGSHSHTVSVPGGVGVSAGGFSSLSGDITGTIGTSTAGDHTHPISVGPNLSPENSHNHSLAMNSHNHTFSGTSINLSVQYVDVIIASKD